MADTKSKESAWWKPALSFFVAGGKAIIAIIAVLAVLIVGWAAWGWYRPEHLLNPINRFALFQLYQAREGGSGSMVAHWRASMVPTVFAPGEPRTEVVQRLTEAGYSLWDDDGEHLAYKLYGGGTAALFVCGNDFLVDLTFDNSDGLLSAESSTGGVCL